MMIVIVLTTLFYSNFTNSNHPFYNNCNNVNTSVAFQRQFQSMNVLIEIIKHQNLEFVDSILAIQLLFPCCTNKLIF